MKPFKIGDCVRLKSGSPPMMVAGDDPERPGWHRCVWFFGFERKMIDSEPQEIAGPCWDVLPAACLELVED